MKNFFIFSLSFLLFSSSLKAALTQEQKDMEVEILHDFVEGHTEHFHQKDNAYISYNSKELKDEFNEQEEEIEKFYAPSPAHITVYKGKDDEVLAMNAVKIFIKSFLSFEIKNIEKKLEDFSKFEGIKLGFKLSNKKQAHMSIFNKSAIKNSMDSLEEFNKKKTGLSREEEIQKKQLEGEIQKLEEYKDKITNNLQDNHYLESTFSSLKEELSQKFYIFFFKKMVSCLDEDAEKLKNVLMKLSIRSFNEGFFTKGLNFNLESKDEDGITFFSNILTVNEEIRQKYLLLNKSLNQSTDDKNKKNLQSLKSLKEITEVYINCLKNLTAIFFDILPKNILDKNPENDLYKFSKDMEKVEQSMQKLEEFVEKQKRVEEKRIKEEQKRIEEKNAQAALLAANKTISSAKVVKLNKNAKVFNPRDSKPNDS